MLLHFSFVLYITVRHFDDTFFFTYQTSIQLITTSTITIFFILSFLFSISFSLSRSSYPSIYFHLSFTWIPWIRFMDGDNKRFNKFNQYGNFMLFWSSKTSSTHIKWLTFDSHFDIYVVFFIALFSLFQWKWIHLSVASLTVKYVYIISIYISFIVLQRNSNVHDYIWCFIVLSWFICFFFCSSFCKFPNYLKHYTLNSFLKYIFI